MNNKLTTPKAILIGSLIIAGSILYTSGNISNPIIRTAHAEINSRDLNTIESNLINVNVTLNELLRHLDASRKYLNDISGHNLMMIKHLDKMKNILFTISKNTR